MYDIAIIGAGICGSTTAHFLTQAGQKVALIDREGIAAGGSGAAGAFISPKFTKGGPLKALLEEAYRFSLAFYQEHFPELIRVAPLIHFAKYDDENEKVRAFKATTTLPMLESMPKVPLHKQTQDFEHVVLAQSGLVDAKRLCQVLANGADFYEKEIDIIQYDNGFWRLGDIKARKVVLATGAYKLVVQMPHIGLRAVWGHRIDIKTTTPLPCHLHQYVSIAATDETGHSAIGATHDVHYHPQTASSPYDFQKGREELLQKAQRTVKLENVEVLRDFVGLRSGSNDYYPMIGPVADYAASLQRHPELLKGIKVDASSLVYYPDLYMINGTGGYGFVLAPLLAQRLAAALTQETAIPAALDPTRFLYRHAKRQGSA